jgi:hypothetical protein
MSCRTSSVGSALTTFHRLASGLSDVQTLSAFHSLRATAPRTAPSPSAEVWSEFLNEQVQSVQTADITDARRASLMRRLDAARSENIPDGRTWHALRNLGERTARQSESIDRHIARVAEGLQVEESVVRARFAQLQAETPRTRRGANPDGYVDQMAISAAAADLPTDRASIMAMRTLEAEAYRARADRALAGPQRIERRTLQFSRYISEIGYDPSGGRLEVVLRSQPDRVFAYRGVPQDVYDDIARHGYTQWATRVRGQSQYRYNTQEEADLDSAARRCGDCGQFAASSHHCPTRIERERVARETALAAERAAEQAARDARTETARAAAETARNAARALAEAGERPAVRSLDAAGLMSWERSNLQAFPDEGGDSRRRYDRVSLPRLTPLRQEAVNGPIEFPVTFHGSFRSANDLDGLPAGRFRVVGRAIYDRPARGQHAISTHSLQCDCPQYRETYDCPHLAYAANALITRLDPTRGTSTASPEQRAERLAQAQRAAEDALRADWMRSEETAAEAARLWAPSAPQDRYSENFAAFESDYQAALDRKARGEDPVGYMRENATGGLCAPGSGRAFGVELEFDIDPGVDRYTALAAIGRDLHAAGLTSSPQQRGYHAGMARGYTENHQGGWSYEQDCTVSGEIVSPIMYDTPETWENVAKVCEIVKRHGGRATARTGSHVHVSSPNTTGATATELLRMANAHEDVMYRVSQNPERGQHRPMRWCGPNQDVAPTGYASANDARSRHNSHGLGVNLQSVGGRASDHAEIRHWDGTLDASVIQTQIKVSAAMMAAAERNGAVGGSRLRGREGVGSHARRMQAVVGRSRRALTSEELESDTATARSFADTLFTRREDKAQFAALFAVTKWNRSSRRS